MLIHITYIQFQQESIIDNRLHTSVKLLHGAHQETTWAIMAQLSLFSRVSATLQTEWMPSKQQKQLPLKKEV